MLAVNDPPTLASARLCRWRVVDVCSVLQPSDVRRLLEYDTTVLELSIAQPEL